MDRNTSWRRKWSIVKFPTVNEEFVSGIVINFKCQLKNTCGIFLSVKYVRILFRATWIKTIEDHSSVAHLLLNVWPVWECRHVYSVLNSRWGSWNLKRLNDLPEDTWQCSHRGRAHQAPFQTQPVSHPRAFAHAIPQHSAWLTANCCSSEFLLSELLFNKCLQVHCHYKFTCLQPLRVDLTGWKLRTCCSPRYFCAHCAELATWEWSKYLLNEWTNQSMEFCFSVNNIKVSASACCGGQLFRNFQDSFPLSRERDHQISVVASDPWQMLHR